MATQSLVFKGNLSLSGITFWGEEYGVVDTTSNGVVTLSLSLADDGSAAGTWVYTGTSFYSGTNLLTQQPFSGVETETVQGTASGTAELIMFFADGDTLVGEASLTNNRMLSGVAFAEEGYLTGKLLLLAEDSGTGNDTPGTGEDIIFEGTPADETVIGGGGNDTLTGGEGDDTIDGGSGSDTLEGGDGDDNLFGGSGNDAIEGGAGNDNLFGGTGNDNITAGDGDDILDGGSGPDRMSGGAGNDTYYVDNKKDVVTETDNAGTSDTTTAVNLTDLGSQVDTVVASVKYTLTNYVENLTLGESSAKLAGTGNGLGNLITGNAGSNKLSGLSGNDTLDGGAGADKLTGGDGQDTFKFSNLATGGADSVTDFVAGDALAFDTGVFGALLAVDANNYANYLVLTKNTLSYDADGSGGAAPIKIVSLKGSGVAALSFDDFVFL